MVSRFSKSNLKVTSSLPTLLILILPLIVALVPTFGKLNSAPLSNVCAELTTIVPAPVTDPAPLTTVGAFAFGLVKLKVTPSLIVTASETENFLTLVSTLIAVTVTVFLFNNEDSTLHRKQLST